MIFHRIEQLNQEVKTKVYDELRNTKGSTSSGKPWTPRSWSSVSSGYARCSAPSCCSIILRPCSNPPTPCGCCVTALTKFRSCGITWRPGSHTAALPENAGRGRTGRQRCPGTGCVPCKKRHAGRILKFTLGPLELWALNSSPKDSALRRALTQEVGSLRARQILAEHFPGVRHLTDRTPRPHT